MLLTPMSGRAAGRGNRTRDRRLSPPRLLCSTPRVVASVAPNTTDKVANGTSSRMHGPRRCPCGHQQGIGLRLRVTGRPHDATNPEGISKVRNGSPNSRNIKRSPVNAARPCIQRVLQSR